jgi:hypothetical protein
VSAFLLEDSREIEEAIEGAPEIPLVVDDDMPHGEDD